MRSITRTALVLLPLLALATPGLLAAQESDLAPLEPPPAGEITETAPAVPPADGDAAPAPEIAEGEPLPASEHEVRNQLRQLLRTQPRSLGPVLVMEPGLLSNREFLDGYPALRSFVDAHPEMATAPGFYLQGIGTAHRVGAAEALLEGLAIFGTFALVALALGWLIRTFIEQKRWNRLSKNQIDVHNRILDRFGSSEELLEYVRTSAGTRFLAAAPIAVHAERGSSPQARIVRSVQIGVVVACAALGMLLISAAFDDEGAQVLFALGVIALSIGLGFIGSAAVSNVLSQRLGLWEPIRPGERDELVP